MATFVYFLDQATARLGWRDLARVYPAGARPPEGIVVHGCGGTVGMNTYRGTLVVTFAKEGIHVAPGPWQGRKRSHPPILLPWSGIKSATRKETSFVRHGVIEFQDADNWTMTLIVPGPGGPDPYAASGWSDFPEG